MVVMGVAKMTDDVVKICFCWDLLMVVSVYVLFVLFVFWDEVGVQEVTRVENWMEEEEDDDDVIKEWSFCMRRFQGMCSADQLDLGELSSML